jgi:hypothetical protein
MSVTGSFNLKKEIDDISVGSRDDDAYPDLASLGLDFPDIASYPNLDDVADAPPNKLLLISYGSPDEENVDPIKHAHRIAFNELALGVDETGTLKEPIHCSKRWSDEKYNIHVAILSQWDNPNVAARKVFRKKYRRGYQMASRYELQAIRMPKGSRKFSLRTRTNVSTAKNSTVGIPRPFSATN